MDVKASARMKSPPNHPVDFAALQDFENGLDLFVPENSAMPCQVLGYGEISTVFKILDPRLASLAYKRMSIFETNQEVDSYLAAFLEYHRILGDEIGIKIPENGYAVLESPSGRPIFYIIQEELPVELIGNNSLHWLSRDDLLALFERILQELKKVWRFNASQAGLDVGIDGQVSNWVLSGVVPGAAGLPEDMPLLYVDTSTPLLRLGGTEQMEPELFLRPAPSFLAWILRLLFLEEVVDRYYDFRKVVIDLLANCYKEGKPELIPVLIPVVNRFFDTEAGAFNLEPIQEKEVRDYYKEDALIWTLYLAMRRFDRFLHRRILGRTYPYLLPGRIRR